jgi:molybdopterin converting factor subunit 1
MRVRLRYFAAIREALGRHEETLDVPRGATVDDVWQLLVTRCPALREQRYRPAVNQEYATTTTVLGEGDEVVFIPPVSGGGLFTRSPRWRSTQSPSGW